MTLLQGIVLVALCLRSQAQDPMSSAHQLVEKDAKFRDHLFTSHFKIGNAALCYSEDNHHLPVSCTVNSLYNDNAPAGTYIKFKFHKAQPILRVKLKTIKNPVFKPSDIWLKFSDGSEKVLSLTKENTYAPAEERWALTLIFLTSPICTDSVILKPLTQSGRWDGQKIEWINFETESYHSTCKLNKGPQGLQKLDLSGTYCLSAPIIGKNFMCQNAYDRNVGTRWATNRGSWSWITVFLKKEMKVGAVTFMDVEENVRELSVRTFHFFLKRVSMSKSTGTAQIPSDKRHPTLTVEVKITKVKHKRNTGFNEISVWIEK